jgi:hypothetical protein
MLSGMILTVILFISDIMAVPAACFRWTKFFSHTITPVALFASKGNHELYEALTDGDFLRSFWCHRVGMVGV